MEAVMLVEVLDDHRRVQQRQRINGVAAQCRIGRSVACDLAIDDPFVAAEHVLLTLQQDGRVLVQDLGSRNGTRLDGQPVDAAAGQLLTSGELLVGRTRVRVRTSEAALQPERPLRRDMLQRRRTPLAIGGLLLCLGFAALLEWMRAPETLVQRLVIAEFVVLVALGLWVGSWSLVSRLTVGEWRVRIQLAIAALCIGLWAWGYWFSSLAVFALQWHWLTVFMIGVALLVAGVAAYLHLRHATHLRPLASLLLALLAPLLCGGVWWLVDLQNDPRTVNRVELGPRVYPPSLRLSPSMDVADYLNDIAGLKRDANSNRQQSLLENPVLDAAD